MVSDEEKLIDLYNYKLRCRDSKFREWLSIQMGDYRKAILERYPWSDKARERYKRRLAMKGDHNEE